MSSEKMDRPRAPFGKRILFALIPLVLLLGLGEVAARFIPGDLKSNRFFYVAGGHEEYYGTEKRSAPYETHPPYHWLGVPRTTLYNSRGFRGREWTQVKAPGTIRVATLGCSCTACGQEPYADRLERVLREALGTNKYEVLNGGIGSSSTCQILQILEQYIVPLKPDVITVFAGWNDRWVHDGRRDSKHRLPSAAKAGLWDWLAGHSRLFKALVYFADQRDKDKKEQRVPADEYARNLHHIAKICRDNGIRLILCTTPDGTTEHFAASRFDVNKKERDWDSELYDLFKDKANGPWAVWNYIQDLYNGKVREVAQAEKIELLDLDAAVRARRPEYQEPPFYFYKDTVHFTELGLQELSLVFARQIVSTTEWDRVAAYAKSPAYFVTNAYQFARQFQPYVSAEYLKRAEAAQGGPVTGIDDLRAVIAADREFYEMFDMGRIELSNRGDLAHVEELYSKCLALRPDEQNVRLELAQLAMQGAHYEKALQYALGANTAYTPQNTYRALWIGVEAANALRRGDMVGQLLQEIVRRFPQDQRARQILAQASGR